jgi:hypothetical protein
MQSDRFQNHPQPRVPFIFAAADPGTTGIAAKHDPVERQVRAAEYIAMYLDRIETHLDRIASVLESGNVNEKLRQEVATIAHLLPRLAKAP